MSRTEVLSDINIIYIVYAGARSAWSCLELT